MLEARTILWIMAFTGCAINYLVGFNLSIVILEMKEPEHSVNDIFDLDYSSDFLENSGTMTDSTPQHFQWTVSEKVLAINSFYWAYWITPILGGILGKKFGTKIIFGLPNVISCWLCFFIPMAAKMDLYILMALRILQGLLTGLALPTMNDMAAKWIPTNERSKFVTAYFGGSIGLTVFYPLYAYIMVVSSWEWPFHVSGVLGTIWWFAWLYLVYNTPAEHPRISSAELEFIAKSLANTKTNSNASRIPWIKILISKSVWMNIIAQIALLYAMFTLSSLMPMYFSQMYHWDIKANGLLSSLPELLRFLVAIVFSLYADHLLNKNKMSRTNVRKFATGLACFATGIIALVLACLVTNLISAITLVTFAVAIQGCGSSGPLSSMIDISPNYAGIIFGIYATITGLSGALASYIFSDLTLNNEFMNVWTYQFLICAGILICCGALYIFFADSSLQAWNDNTEKKTKNNAYDLKEKNFTKFERV